MTMHGTDQPAGNDTLTGLRPKWQTRFRFFQAHGSPGMWKTDRDFQAAFKALPTRERMVISFNGFAFFFGAFYLAYLGMWRKALTFLGIGVVVGAVSITLDLSSTVDIGLTCGLAGYLAARTNSLYYEHRALGRNTWGL